MIEQGGVMRFLWAKNMDAAKEMHIEMLPIWAAFLCGKIAGHFSLTVPPSTAGCSRMVTHVKTPCGKSWNV
jgi:hypothetical protein